MPSARRKRMPGAPRGTKRLGGSAAKQRLLEARVSSLEKRMGDLTSDVGQLREGMAAMRHSLRMFEDRQIRGEKILLAMQFDQTRALKALDRIIEHLGIQKLAVHPPVDEVPT